MRLTTLSLVIAVTLLAALSMSGHASAVVATPDGAAVAGMHQQTPQPVPSNDDSRVGVQVGVLGAAVAVVVVAGTCAYFVRKRLGLGGPPPQQDAGGHH